MSWGEEEVLLFVPTGVVQDVYDFCIDEQGHLERRE